MASKGDVEFGNLAMKEKMATRVQVDDSLKYLGELEAAEQLSTLDRVMLQKGYLTEQQVFDLNKKQGRRVIFCGKCQMKLNVAGLAMGQKVKCPKCAHVNLVPEKIVFQILEKAKGSPEAPAGDRKTVAPKAPETVKMSTEAVKSAPVKLPEPPPPAPAIELGEAGEAPPPEPPKPPPVPAAPPEKAADAGAEKGPKKFATRRYGKK